MSNPEETNRCVPDTQETYYEGANESFKVRDETQTMNLNESQDFRLIDSGGDESLVETMKQTQDEEANPRKSVESMDSQQIPDASEVDNKAITTNDKKDDITHEKVKENEAIEKTDKNVASELCESEKKDEFFDEDEVIQGTPPQSYTPSRKMGSVDVTSLKRKARTVDGTPAKIARTASTEDTMNVKKQLAEEENHQSCESDDSYQDLFKNIDKNVIIEETQDPTNLEFNQNSLKISTEHATEPTDNGKAREHRTEHTDQQRDEECNVEKDENLNVSAKLIDTSANDSIVVDLNSTNENDSQLEDGNLSVETKGDVTTNVVIADEKSGIGTLDETESVRDTETMSDENNQIMKSNCTESDEKTVDDNDEEIPSSQTKSRISVELIYEGGGNLTVGDGESKSKPQIVQIDDDGEKVVLDSSAETYDSQKIKTRPEIVQIDDSHEDNEKNVLDSLGKNFATQAMDKSSYESKSSTEFSYKSIESMKESSLDSKLTSDKRLVNGSTDSKRCDIDVTLSVDSDMLSGSEEQALLPALTAMHDVKNTDSAKNNSFASRITLLKDTDNVELISISDNETSNVEEKNKFDLIYNSTAKTVQVEREIGLFVKLKCLMHVDESTKEVVGKELTQCEPVIIESTMGRQKNEDSQSLLADISDNKDSSPGSVNSNPQLYQLNPSRLSIMSTISSSSSASLASSAASLAIKLATKITAHPFSVPTGPAKHAKKSFQDVLSTSVDKQPSDELYDRLTREWKNHRLLTTTILHYVNTELGNLTTTTTPITATTSTVIDAFANVSNERLDDHHHLEKNMRSSTPSDQLMNVKMELPDTPKNTNKSKAIKRPRSKITKLNAAQINCENGTNNIPNEPTLHTSATETDTPIRKKSKMENTKDKLPMSDTDVLTNSSPRSESLVDELIGKNVFAKWSDNTYYPGTVSDWLKGKYKVNFFDGQSKTLIPEFVIPIPKFLRKGLSVFATTETDKNNYYGSCGVIVNVETSDDDNTYYTVETDEGEQLRVQIQNIYLSADQAQFLKEEMNSTDKSCLPSTPKALAQVTLDNVIDGKRRSKRIGTPLFSTPKSRSNVASTSTSKTKSEPSGSGMSAKKPKKQSASENDGMSSDSNVESTQIQDIHVLRGVQKEIIGTPYEHMKGPQSRIKSKPRSKKKMEDPHMIATLGPIPTNSNLFKGMSFILTCASLETLPRYLDMKSVASTLETEATETDETENEDEWWMDRPFLRDRLHEQILAGSGKIYENFEQIPKAEYKNTMLITHIPNTTEKSILCLSVGIRACNHKWIIRCCAEEKMVNPAEYALPNGWSFQKKAYVERFETSGNKPLSKVVVIIPHLVYDEQFVTFWRQVCENAGAVVLIAENSGAMEKMDFDSSNVVVVSNPRCPLWAINRAARLQIPVLSTAWVIQCLIEGKLCPQDHPRYKYSYISN